ncbi:MAG: winged helix-turn-helix domain-containing protein [Myxococcales bacterium]|nr:MAG: winged helix-turn-helix domain-containing protein [Myxococcales bacterium]
MALTPAALRRAALTRSLPPATSLPAAIRSLGFVQADPIRSPARAQDLILMQRVRNYRTGDLERRYPSLRVEEDMLQNYGFVPREVQALVHPRVADGRRIHAQAPGLAERVLAFVRERGHGHPREVGEHFGRTRVENAWGGGSSATTRALEALHYGGHLRVARRERGLRVYEPAHHLAAVHAAPLAPAQQARGLLALVLAQLAPLPVASLGQVVTLLGYGAPHLRDELRAGLKSLPAERAVVDGVTYLWPEGETLPDEADRRVRLLAPFDPVVWDRRRFAHLHGWTYKFEAYTPAPERQLGYYALPLFWGERAIGWANLAVVDGSLDVDLGFVDARPKGKAFDAALEAELARHRAFLGLE